MKNLFLVLKKSTPVKRHRFITYTILTGIILSIVLAILVRISQFVLPELFDTICSIRRVNLCGSTKELVIKVPTTIHMGDISTIIHGYSLYETIAAWVAVITFVLTNGILIKTIGRIALFVVLRYFTICANSFKLDEAIPANHGKSLIAVVCRTRHAPLEYTSAFRCDGSKIGEGTLLSPTKTQLVSSELSTTKTITGCIDLHNHPHTNAAFSSNDFRAAISRRVRFSHVIAGNMFYTLELTERHWSLDLNSVSEYYKKICDNLESRHQIINETTRVQIIYDTCRKTADQFGITFTAESYYSWLAHQLWLRAKATFANLHHYLVMVLPQQARS